MLTASASDSRAGLGTRKCRVGCANSAAGGLLPGASVVVTVIRPKAAETARAATVQIPTTPLVPTIDENFLWRCFGLPAASGGAL
jgi:hypothetical protein